MAKSWEWCQAGGCHCRRPLGGGDNVVGRPVPISRVSFTTTVFGVTLSRLREREKTRDEKQHCGRTRERVPRFRFWEALIGPGEGIVAKHGAWPGLLAGHHPASSLEESGNSWLPSPRPLRAAAALPGKHHARRDHYLGHVGRGSSLIFQTSLHLLLLYFVPSLRCLPASIITFKLCIFYGTISHWRIL